MKTVTLVCSVSLILLIGCHKEISSCSIENNQSIYYGKSEKTKFITVQNNRSIADIAREIFVPESEIQRLNPTTSYTSFNKGQILQIPVAQFHLVRDDETVRDIAQIYDINVESLLKENNHRIYSGQYIRIPDTVAGCMSHEGNGYIASQEPNISLAKGSKKINYSKVHEQQDSQDSQAQRFRNYTPLNNLDFVWPIQGKILKKYGNHNGKLHDSINIAAPRETNILAAGDGEVIFTGYKHEKFGNLVIIKHSNGYMSAYSHCNKVLVAKNEFVKKGTIIATCGATGNVTRTQLQFTMKKGNHIIDPDG